MSYSLYLCDFSSIFPLLLSWSHSYMCHLTSNYSLQSFPNESWISLPHPTSSVKFPCSFPSMNSCNMNCSSKHLKLSERMSLLVSPLPSLTHSLAHRRWPHPRWPFYADSFPWNHKWPSIYQISGSILSLPQLDLSVTLTSLITLSLKLFSFLNSKLSIASLPFDCFTKSPVMPPSLFHPTYYCCFLRS